MILGLQITGVVFSLIMVYFANLHYKKGNLNGAEIITWTVIWLLVVVICIFPEIFRAYSQTIAITRLLDLLVAGGFVLVIVMISSTYVRVKKLEKKFEDFVRKKAIDNTRKKK